nr:triosephosphate isomerase [Candidatus Levybacteria bacterium]
MDKLFIVANLKSYKTETEARVWLEVFKKINENPQVFTQKEILICPSFTLLSLFSNFFKENNLPVKVGAQNVSPFEEGAYTGEVNAGQIKEFGDYVIIGHSERRSNFKESDDVLLNKVKISLEHGLTPVYCVQDKDTLVPENVSILAYEPIFAIGSGNPDTPENADEVAKSFVDKNKIVLYGGSVNPENIRSFTQKENIKGVLVGGASLDGQEFIKIIQNA